VIEQVSMKLQTDAIKNMEAQQTMMMQESELNSLRKQCENYKTQLEQLKDVVEKLSDPKGKKKKKWI